MSKPIKTVVIGYGHLGKWHVQKAIELENCEFIGIVDPSDEARKRFLSENENYQVFSSLDQVIDKIDAGIVVTPTVYHFENILTLLNKKKHVFCEKPITRTYEEALMIKDVVEKQEVVFQAGHSERFHKIWEEKSQYPEFFENPATIRIQRMAPFKGRATDVDVVQDLMIHDIDLVHHLFDEVPYEIRAVGHKIRTDKWDFVSAQFHFHSGRNAYISVGRNYIKEVRELDITNASGCLHVNLMDREVSIAKYNEIDIFKKKYEARDHLLQEQKAFYNSIIRNEKPVVDVQDGVLAVKLVNKVLESLDSGQTTKV